MLVQFANRIILRDGVLVISWLFLSVDAYPQSLAVWRQDAVGSVSLTFGERLLMHRMDMYTLAGLSRFSFALRGSK